MNTKIMLGIALAVAMLALTPAVSAEETEESAQQACDVRLDSYNGGAIIGLSESGGIGVHFTLLFVAGDLYFVPDCIGDLT